MEYHVALCGLTDHKAHLIQVVIGSASASKYKFRVGQPESLEWVDIAVVETLSSVSSVLLAEVRRRNPQVVVVTVSDHGLSGESRFRIARSSLLLQIQRLLIQVVEEEILGEKVRSLGLRAPVVREPVPVPAGPVAVSREMAAAFDLPAEAGAQAGLTALIVDDSATVRAQARAALQRAGIGCCEAEDAEHAMRQLTQRRFDFALFDVMMPGVNGYELCRRVKHDPRTRSMPVLMITSRSSPFDRARGALVGCDSYLVKPIAWESFFRAIEKVLSKVFKNDRSAMVARGFREGTGVAEGGVIAPSMKGT